MRIQRLQIAVAMLLFLPYAVALAYGGAIVTVLRAWAKSKLDK